MTISELAGRYRLASWRRTDGSEPFGPHPKGVLTYGSDGQMSVMFSASKRVPIGLPLDELMEVKSRLKRPWTLLGSGLIGGLKRYIDGVSNFMAYSGTYEVDGTTVRHHLDLSLIADWEGTELERSFVLDGDSLTLVAPEGDILVWQRDS
ncbi:MAG: lipocalin-like domain-containing protein [Acidimicrobiia bacterium]|nr:lipocalin-like domain-containing protein [Acidimicrobiia bacterium]